MALVGSLSLAIRAQTEKLKTDLRPALDAINEWGKAALAAGASTNEVERAMARMRAEAMRGGQAVAEKGRDIEKALRNAKQGAAALAGAMTVLSSDVGGAVGHVTRLGGAFVSAFLAGGPVALALTGVSALISGIVGAMREVSEELERVAEESRKVADESRKALDKLYADEAGKRDQLDVLKGYMTQHEADTQALKRQYDQRVRDHKEALNRMRSDIERWSQEYAAELLELARMGHPDVVTGEMEKRKAWIALSQEKIAAAERQFEAENRIYEVEQRILDTKREQTEAEKARNTAMQEGRAAAERMAANYREIAEAQNEVYEESKRIKKESEEMREVVKDILALWDKAAKARLAEKGEVEREKMADKYREIADEQNEAWRTAEKQAKTASDLRASLEKENALLKAGSDSARNRLRLEQQLRENLSKAGDDQAAKMAAVEHYQLRLTELSKEEAEAAKQKAKAEQEALEAKKQQAALVGKRSDITKRFANFGGNSIFGFGAGQSGTGIGDLGGDAAAAMKKAGGIPKNKWAAKGGAAGAPGNVPNADNVPDPTQQVAELVKQIEKWVGVHEKDAKALDSMSKATVSAVDRVGKSTVAAVGKIRSDVKQLEAKVRGIEERLARAASMGAGN